MKVTNKKLLVKPDAVSDTTPAGIALPKNVRGSGVRRGTVEVVGTNVDEIMVGDRVVYDAGHARSLEYEGVEYALLYQDDILLIE